MVCSLVSIHFPNQAYNKSKLYNILDYWSRDMLNFDFLEKWLGIASPPYFVCDFSRKMFFMLYSINWPNFIAWLPLLLEIFVNIRLLTRLWRHKFWSLPYLSNHACMTKMSRQKFKYLENEKSFWGEIKNIFHHF